VGSGEPGMGTKTMQDVIFLAMTILFFAISLAYAIFCERVR
jgi:hypothetical protein